MIAIQRASLKRNASSNTSHTKSDHKYETIEFVPFNDLNHLKALNTSFTSIRVSARQYLTKYTNNFYITLTITLIN